MEKQRKVFFAIHPKFDILFTVGDDCYLKVWNTERKEWKFQKHLGYQHPPTSIAIHPVHGNLLMIGQSNGHITQYDSQITHQEGKDVPEWTLILPEF